MSESVYRQRPGAEHTLNSGLQDEHPNTRLPYHHGQHCGHCGGFIQVPGLEVGQSH